jgi:hypothetical protein
MAELFSHLINLLLPVVNCAADSQEPLVNAPSGGKEPAIANLGEINAYNAA